MPKTLLLADDSVVIQKLVGLSFANEDVELVTTDNGDDALTRARAIRPDLVLADVVMPGKNGYEVCQAIKTDPELNTTPVLLLTGTFEAFDEERARQVGSDGHITKPFEAQGLVDRVTDLLSKPRPAAPTPAAAPPAPRPAPAAAAPAAAPASEGDDAYDFFDDEVQELAAPEAPATAAAAASPDDSFEFGDDLDPLDDAVSGVEPETLDTGFDLDAERPEDLTVAVPADPIPARPVAAPDATRVDMGETMIADDFAAPAQAPVASLDEQLAATPPAPPAASAPPPPADPAETMLADDLFADPPAATPPPAPRAAASPQPTPAPPKPAAPPQAPPAPAVTPAPAAAPRPAPAPASDVPPAMDSGFEFGFEEPEATPTAQPAAAQAPTPQAPPPAPRTDAFGSGIGEDVTAPSPEPSRSEVFDLHADDPLADVGARSAEMPSFDAPDAHDPDLADAADSTHSGYDVSVSDLGDPLAAGPGGPERAPAAEPVSMAGHGDAPEISPAMRAQIHETLEKVAWEAFADVSDTIVKQVLQRVESIVWEVVPQMAEALIQEEIRRMKGED